MSGKIAEFFAEIGLKGDDAAGLSLRQLIGNMGDLEVATLAETGALGSLAYKFTQIATEAYAAAAALGLFEATTGLNSQELQRWQIAGEQANVSIQTVTSSVTALERQMAAIRLGQGNIQPFLMLGIDPRNQTAFGVLRQLRERIKGLDRPTATNILSQMGIDPSMIQLLQLTNSEFAKLADYQQGIGARQEREFIQGEHALKRLGLAVRQIGYDLVEVFGPIFTAMVRGAAAGVDFLAQGFMKMVSSLERMGIIFTGLKLVLAGLALYFFPVTAAIVGLLLVLDDVATYFKGGKSITGEAVEGFKKMAEALKPLTDLMGNVGKMMAPALMATTGLLPGLAGQAAGAAARVVTVNAPQTVHVQGGDAKNIADHVTDAHKRQINQSSLQLDNAGY